MAMILQGTDGLTYPTWTTAGRPSTPSLAQCGYNTSLNVLEIYNGTAWVAVGDQAGSYSVEYLVTAGGGGGGGGHGGGGGAGGYRTASGYTVITNTAYTVTIGAGGTGGSSYSPGILFLTLLHQQVADLALVIKAGHQELEVLVVRVEAVVVRQVVQEALQLLGRVVRVVLHQQVVEEVGEQGQLGQTALAVQVVMVVLV